LGRAYRAPEEVFLKKLEVSKTTVEMVMYKGACKQQRMWNQLGAHWQAKTSKPQNLVLRIQ
jgi:hypothetical protein